MYMTASRKIIDEKVVLKLRLHDFNETDLQFLASLGIDKQESGGSDHRFILLHSQEAFRATRAAILEKYRVVEEKGPRVILEPKQVV